MARELVSSVLEVQLQQLDENGLRDLPLYRDIEGMRDNLGKLVDAEMVQVVDLLAKAQQGDKVSREKSFLEARKLIREVIVRLSYERQMLLRRLKSAELAAQTRRVIELETKTTDATKVLPDQPQSKREMSALQTIEDQRDVGELVLQLIDSLSDVSQWDGPIGAAAGEGVQILHTADVGKELDAAVKKLEATNYIEAVTNQQSALRGLQALLARLEAARGLLDDGRHAALEAIREAMRKQQAVRDETRNADAAKTDPDKLVTQQSEVARHLLKLAESLADQPAAKELVEQAREAAAEARTDLFESKLPEALRKQDDVLANLAEAVDRLEADPLASEPIRSAEEMAARVRDLQTAAREMAAIQTKQAEAHKSAAEEHSAKTGAQEKDVAAAIEKVAEERKLPQSVETRLAKAAETVRKAEESANAAAEHRRDAGATEKMQHGVAKADDAVEMAAAEVNMALADAKRQAEAIKIGELARAAEVLERAAAAERQVAREAGEVAKSEAIDAKIARDLAAKQQQVTEIADQVAKAIEHTAPRAAEQTRTALESGRAAERGLELAARQPGESSKPAASEAAKQADKAAAGLQQAAKSLRKEIGSAAKSLAAESAKQREQVAAVKNDVRQAIPDGEASAREWPVAGMAKPLAAKAAAVDAPATSALQSAARSKPTRKPGDPPTGDELTAAQGDAQRALERTAASLAAREDRVRRDQAIAEAIARMAEEQQHAVEQLAAVRASQSAAPNEGQSKPSGIPQPGGSGAAMPQAQFAQAQRATGQGAAEVSGQSEVANPPLREALELASNLSSTSKPGAAAEPGQTAEQPSPKGAATGKGSSSPGRPGTAAPAKLSSDAPAGTSPPASDHAAGIGQHDDSPASTGFDASLGSGLVPNSPEVTAQMIAGSDPASALAAAMAANAAASQPGLPGAPGQPPAASPSGQTTPSDAASANESETQGQTSGNAAGGNATSGQSAPNQAVKDGSPSDSPATLRERDSRTGDGGSRDVENSATPFQNEPWFAKLPPDLRQAIRARSQRPPPRGYEQRLRRYFESLD